MQFSQEHVKAIFYAVFGGISKLCDRGLENRVFFNCNVLISRFPLSPPMKTLDFKTLDYLCHMCFMSGRIEKRLLCRRQSFQTIRT